MSTVGAGVPPPSSWKAVGGNLNGLSGPDDGHRGWPAECGQYAAADIQRTAVDVSSLHV